MREDVVCEKKNNEIEMGIWYKRKWGGGNRLWGREDNDEKSYGGLCEKRKVSEKGNF